MSLVLLHSNPKLTPRSSIVFITVLLTEVNFFPQNHNQTPRTKGNDSAKSRRSTSIMFSKALLLLLTVIAGALAAGVTNILNGTLQYTSTDAVDNVSSYTFQDPFCIVDVNLVDYSWAIVIPRDGSETEAGYDGAGDCGGRFKREMQGGKLVALTKW